MTLGTERRSVQNPFVRYASEVGWTYLAPEHALRLRAAGVMSPVLDAVLIEQLQKLNPGIVDYQGALDTVKRLVRVRPNIEGNLDAWEFLTGLKTIFLPPEKRERDLRLINTERFERNQFHVTDEFTFSNGTPPNMRADIVFFVNGIPVLLTEAKPPTASQGIAQALDDLRYYHEKGPELLAITQLQAVTHLIHLYYGATWNTSLKSLFSWRDDVVAAGDFESICKSFVAPRRILDVLTHGILFTRKDDELSKVVLRPHQMRAVDRSVGRARDETKTRGLVWHTQGSGKTYTMIVTAKRLIKDPLFENPTVLMLVDRNELETQLFGNLEAVGFGHVIVADSKEHLQELLRRDQRGLIVSMIHKFDQVPEAINTRKNIFVLVDEAHRTTSGDLGNYLMGALPNATYLGYTGTPIDKTAYGRGTFKVFGVDDKEGYLDKYSIRESIQDGTTVPIHYALAPNELRVDRDILDKEFLNLAEAQGVSDIEEVNRILEKAVTLRNMLKNQERIERVAAYVANHFRENIEPMGYKAFLVGVDREACCLYKEALDRLLPPVYSTVVISEAWKKDPEHMRRQYLSEDQEKKVRKAFTKPDTLPKILIVTEKLLTGFDAPILYAMYLDKPMRDHVLLQAIARVNRPYEDTENRRKTCGFILDFVGIFDHLEKALAFDSKDVAGVIEGVDILRKRFGDQMTRGRSEYLPIIVGKDGDKAVEAVLDRLHDAEVREEFYRFFKGLQDIYEILSPDAFLRAYLDDFNALLRMYHILHAAYERNKPVDREFLRKTAKLVQEHTQTGAIENPTKFHALNAKALEALAATDAPETVKVFNLLKALAHLVRERAGGDPYLLSIGDRAEGIAQAFEMRQMTTQDALNALQGLVQDVKEAERSREDTGLSPEAFAVYYVLKTEEIKDPLAVARRVEEAFARYPHWHQSERQEQDLRRALYKALIDAGVEAVAELAQRLMNLLRRAAP